jgi:hypothetical protein
MMMSRSEAMQSNMQFITPASALEAVLKLRGFKVVSKGKDIDVSLPRGARTITLNPRSYVASSGRNNYVLLKGTTPNEIADELAALLRDPG